MGQESSDWWSVGCGHPRMNISPNTVKVFLRLIMIKMGVTSRGAIIAQILQRQFAPSEREEKAIPAKASTL
jgi:hypothetical protein